MSIPQTAPLSREEAALFYRLGAEGTVLLLLQRLGNPTGAREVAWIMGIDEHTAAKYLLSLSERSLAVRLGHKQGYRVAEAGRIFLARLYQSLFQPQVESGAGDPDDMDWPEADDPAGISQDWEDEMDPRAQDARHTAHGGAFSRQAGRRDGAGITRYVNNARTGQVKNYPQRRAVGAKTAQNIRDPVNTTISDTHLNNHLSNISEEEGGKAKMKKNTPNGKDPREAGIWEELKLAGIGVNRRTQELVRLPHMTPEYVRGHRLQMEARGKGGPGYAGLLVTILEGGEPAPEINDNGHLADCECLDCERFRLLRSWSKYTDV